MARAIMTPPSPGGSLARVPRLRPAHLLTLVAVGLGLYCGVRQAAVGAPDPARWPEAALASGGGRIDGIPVGDAEEARFRVQAVRPGDWVRVETADGSADVPVVSAYGAFPLAVTFTIGLLFAFVCFFVFAARSPGEPAQTFLAASLGYMLAVFAGAVHFPADASPLAFVPPITRMLGLLATPVLFLRIAFLFPRPDPRRDGHGLVLVAGALAAAILVVEIITLLAYRVEGGSATYGRFVLAGRVASGFLALLVVGGSIVLAGAARRSTLAREREQVKWVAWGSMVGAFPFGLFYALPRALGLAPVVPLEIARLFAGIVPLSYGIAVARHRFMDVDVIIRRSLLYGSMAALLTIAYLVLAIVLGGRSPEARIDWSDTVRVIAAGAAVALFHPTRRVLGGWIDRAFFKLRADHAERAQLLREDLGTIADPEELARRLAAHVRESLEPADVAVRLDAAAPWPGTRALAGSTAHPEIELAEAEWPAAFAGFVLARPLGAEGTLLLGPHAHGRRYLEEDLAFLDTVAEDAGRALERIRLVRKAAEESLRRAEQDALDRRKREFLTQVAHDLRTPLTSILWSAQNALDGVAGPVSDAVARDVNAIRTSARHLDRLVTHLLEIARLEAGADESPLEPVALEPVVAETLETLRPIARTWDVRLESALADGLPAVRARREGVARIVVNLVENALRHAPAGSAVDVALASEDDRLVLTVRDRGPGVPASEHALVFERFRRGRVAAARGGEGGPSPGLGLGLSVVRAWMERFGGAVDIESPVDGGARFVCRFVPWSSSMATPVPASTPEGDPAWRAS